MKNKADIIQQISYHKKIHITKTQVGEGMYSKVWVAEDLMASHFSLVVKEYDNEVIQSEIEFLLTLSGYTTIIQIMGAITDLGFTALVMRNEGKSLEYYINEKLQSIISLEALTADMLEALHVLHVHGIFHKDLKPANILIICINGQGIAKLCDLGSAGTLECDVLEGKGRALGYRAPEIQLENTSILIKTIQSKLEEGYLQILSSERLSQKSSRTHKFKIYQCVAVEVFLDSMQSKEAFVETALIEGKTLQEWRTLIQDRKELWPLDPKQDGAATDIFALGLTLRVYIKNELPFINNFQDIPKYIFYIISQNIPTPFTEDIGSPYQLFYRDIVEGMLISAPQERWTLEKVREKLKQFPSSSEYKVIKIRRFFDFFFRMVVSENDHNALHYFFENHAKHGYLCLKIDINNSASPLIPPLLSYLAPLGYSKKLIKDKGKYFLINLDSLLENLNKDKSVHTLLGIVQAYFVTEELKKTFNSWGYNDDHVLIESIITEKSRIDLVITYCGNDNFFLHLKNALYQQVPALRYIATITETSFFSRIQFPVASWVKPVRREIELAIAQLGTSRLQEENPQLTIQKFWEMLPCNSETKIPSYSFYANKNNHFLLHPLTSHNQFMQDSKSFIRFFKIFKNTVEIKYFYPQVKIAVNSRVNDVELNPNKIEHSQNSNLWNVLSFIILLWNCDKRNETLSFRLTANSLCADFFINTIREFFCCGVTLNSNLKKADFQVTLQSFKIPEKKEQKQFIRKVTNFFDKNKTLVSNSFSEDKKDCFSQQDFIPRIFFF